MENSNNTVYSQQSNRGSNYREQIEKTIESKKRTGVLRPRLRLYTGKSR